MGESRLQFIESLIITIYSHRKARDSFLGIIDTLLLSSRAQCR